jgi:hypothetical protein
MKVSMKAAKPMFQYTAFHRAVMAVSMSHSPIRARMTSLRI